MRILEYQIYSKSLSTMNEDITKKIGCELLPEDICTMSIQQYDEEFFLISLTVWKGIENKFNESNCKIYSKIFNTIQ